MENDDFGNFPRKMFKPPLLKETAKTNCYKLSLKAFFSLIEAFRKKAKLGPISFLRED
jgi:hypothetical protein